MSEVTEPTAAAYVPENLEISWLAQQPEETKASHFNIVQSWQLSKWNVNKTLQGTRLDERSPTFKYFDYTEDGKTQQGFLDYLCGWSKHPMR